MDIELIHVGCDGLDVAFNTQISPELSAFLREKQSLTREMGEEALASLNGLDFHVERGGKTGGYAYTCYTGATGERWWFKDHRASVDEKEIWGVFVSVRAVRCQMQGIAKVREHLIERLWAFGIQYEPGIESINRVDIAVDMRLPGFALDNDRFVMGHRFSRTERGEGNSEWAENGSGRRTTYLRIGQTKSRAIAMYDKRKDLVEHPDKRWIQDVWNHRRKKEGKPLIDVLDEPIGSIWRFECRWGKRGLTRKRSNITTFKALCSKLKFICRDLLNDIRMVIPTDDLERWRCPVDPVWIALREAVQSLDVELATELPEEVVQEKSREEKAAMYLNFIAGCMISLAGLYGVRPERMIQYVPTVTDRVVSLYRSDLSRMTKKLERALERAGHVLSPAEPIKDTK